VSRRLDGRRALITGGGQGLGLAIAEQYVREGASVFLCGRRPEPLDAAVAALNGLAEPGQHVAAAPADVASPVDVERVVAQAHEALGGLDVLVCNAGINGAKGPAESVDWQEWTDTIGTNLFGAVLCCRAVIPIFKAQRQGKIILLSGGGAANPRPYFSAYAASKAALVRFGESVAEELRGTGIDVNSVSPGAMNTRLLDDMLEAGPERIGAAAYAQAVKQRASGGTPMATPATLCAFLASAESVGITGRLISAVWDDWAALPDHAAELRTSDIYTLRRIVPADRGRTWE
jgi:NAD(P)-dependent dehydrogenase (short-subunit alcohol dehydrogenase family)